MTRELRRQQIAVLVRQSPLLAVINLLNALLVCLVIWGSVPTTFIAPWLAAVAVVALYPLRAWVKNRAHGGLKSGIGSGSPRALRRAAFQAGIAGIIWASAAPAFAPYLDVNGGLFLSLVLAGMSCGGAVVLSPIPAAAVAYALPGMVAVMVMFISHGEAAFAALAVMLLFFLCTVVFAVRQVLTEAIGNLCERIAQGEQRALYQERFRDFAEAASDWMWESDGDGQFTYLSDGVGATEARPITLLLRGSPLLCDFVTDAEHCAALIAAVTQQQQFRDFVYRLVGAAGNEQFIAVSGRPRYDVEGQFLGYRGTAADITERVVHARQLERAQKELSAMVKETETAYAELERKHRDLEEANQELAVAGDNALLANESKSSFLANMSHELRTPLNAIIGFSQLIADESLGPLDAAGNKDTYRGYARDVLTSGRHLLEIINDILDLSRLEVGKLELKEQDCPIVDIVDTTVRLMNERARANGLKLVVNVGVPAGTKLTADPTKLKQILINLISNSVKFTPRGGSICLTAEPGDDGGLVFDVSDTGIGMTEQDLAQVTQPFVQGDSIYHKRFAGAGLGLSIVKALAEMHEATMHISSVPERGTTVRVAFPADRVVEDVTAPAIGATLTSA